jgi:hypothetical protein
MTNCKQKTPALKTPVQLLEEHLNSYKLIQMNCNLTYACLLIEKERIDLAVNYLQPSRKIYSAREERVWFFIQVQLLASLRNYAICKRMLLDRMEKHPDDFDLLSALQYVIWKEFLEFSNE